MSDIDDEPIPKDLCDVYALFSSRDGVIRWIGQTQDVAEARHAQWLKGAKSGYDLDVPYVFDWIRRETAAGHSIELRVLIRGGRWDIDEIQMIAHYRAEGAPLLNRSPGGGGRKHEWMMPLTRAQTRAKISAAMRGREHTVETKLKMAEAQRKRAADDAFKAAMAAIWPKGDPVKLAAKVVGRRLIPKE